MRTIGVEKNSWFIEDAFDSSEARCVSTILISWISQLESEFSIGLNYLSEGVALVPEFSTGLSYLRERVGRIGNPGFNRMKTYE